MEALGPAAAANLVPMEVALEEMPALAVDAAEAQRVLHGGLVERSGPPGPHRVMGPDGALLAIAELEHGRLKYRRVMRG